MTPSIRRRHFKVKEMLKNDLILVSVKSEPTFLNLKQNETQSVDGLYGMTAGCSSAAASPTFVEEHHDLLKGLHEVDVVVAVLLDLQEQHQLRLALSAEQCQQRSVVLTKSTQTVTH